MEIPTDWADWTPAEDLADQRIHIRQTGAIRKTRKAAVPNHGVDLVLRPALCVGEEGHGQDERVHRRHDRVRAADVERGGGPLDVVLVVGRPGPDALDEFRNKRVPGRSRALSKKKEKASTITLALASHHSDVVCVPRSF